eukprot:c24261_g1_i1 orf=36-767(-)
MEMKVCLCVAFVCLFGGRPSSSSLSAAPTLPTCEKIECPKYEVLYQNVELEFEIRRYNESVWMSTAALQDLSFRNATRIGFLQLFAYIQGKNELQANVPMTAPVLTGILPSDGPFCTSTFWVRFYVPEDFQKDPPHPDFDLQLHAEYWGYRCFAVRKFRGFATDDNVAEEASNLEASLSDTPWAGIATDIVVQTQETYIIAQYNSPFEFSGRLNEVWLPIPTCTPDCLPQPPSLPCLSTRIQI